MGTHMSRVLRCTVTDPLLQPLQVLMEKSLVFKQHVGFVEGYVGELELRSEVHTFAKNDVAAEDRGNRQPIRARLRQKNCGSFAERLQLFNEKYLKTSTHLERRSF